MKRRLPRFGLLTLLALPAMFGLGWWARGLNYERDVYAAAEKIADDSGGVFIPELGIIRGGKQFTDRYRALSSTGKAEMERRLKYTEATEPGFGPPKHSNIESSGSRFSEHAAVEDTIITSDETSAPPEIDDIFEVFRQLRDRTLREDSVDPCDVHGSVKSGDLPVENLSSPLGDR